VLVCRVNQQCLKSSGMLQWFFMFSTCYCCSFLVVAATSIARGRWNMVSCDSIMSFQIHGVSYSVLNDGILVSSRCIMFLLVYKPQKPPIILWLPYWSPLTLIWQKQSDKNINVSRPTTLTILSSVEYVIYYEWSVNLKQTNAASRWWTKQH